MANGGRSVFLTQQQKKERLADRMGILVDIWESDNNTALTYPHVEEALSAKTANSSRHIACTMPGAPGRLAGRCEMQVFEAMTHEVVKVAPETTLVDAARTMKAIDVGLLPVCVGDQVVGMLTDRDITVRSVAEVLNVSRARVYELGLKLKRD